MKKLDIINSLIKEHGISSYLEIGLGDGANFMGVKSDQKHCIDPNVTLNEFIHMRTGGKFGNVDSNTFFLANSQKYDLIFIDGFHHSNQVERDIVNAWNCLNPNGIILIHDIKPHNEEMTTVPRGTKQWTGDVFKAWYGFGEKYPKIKTEFINEEFGIGVIYKSRHKVELGFVSDISFVDYKSNYLDVVCED